MLCRDRSQVSEQREKRQPLAALCLDIVPHRKRMSEEKLAAILSKQMPDAIKRGQAHFLVDTGRGFASAERQVGDILRAVAGRPGCRA